MNKEKKRILIIIGIIIAIIALLAYLLSVMVEKEEVSNDPDKPTLPEEPSLELNKEIAKLDDDSIFFTIQNIINDYYNLIFTGDTSALLQVLDPKYIQEYHITSDNIYSIIRNDYNMPSYVVSDIYYNPDSSFTYYFINGYLMDIPLVGTDYDFYDSISYLIIVDESTKQYVLRPISTMNIEEYANNYDIEVKKFTSDNSFKITTISEDSKLTTYLSEFVNLLVYFPDEAYQLLSDEKQKEYTNYDHFVSQVVEIYDKLSTRVFSYGSKKSDGIKIYEVIDDNQNKIIIYEYGINDFRITY